MGNECSPASCVRPSKKAVESTTIVERDSPVIHSVCEIILMPTYDSQDTTQQNPASYLNSPEDEGDCKEDDIVKKVSSSLIAIQELSTKTQLHNDQEKVEEVPSIINSEVDGMRSTRNRRKLKLEGPSEPRESLLDAWNRSDFSESQFFMPVNYDKLFCNEVAVVRSNIK